MFFFISLRTHLLKQYHGSDYDGVHFEYAEQLSPGGLA